jgi:hypothetical protein
VVADVFGDGRDPGLALDGRVADPGFELPELTRGGVEIREGVDQ